MSKEIISTGKTIEQAIENGLLELGVSRDDVSVELLEQPVKKLFRSTPAKVKLVLDTQEEPKVEEKPVAIAQPKQEPKPEKKAEPKTAKTEGQKPQREKKPANKTKEPSKKSNRSLEDDSVLKEKVDIATDFLSHVLNAMQINDVKMTPHVADRGPIIDIDGDGVSALIGKRGETMEALSYLTSLVANQKGGSFEKMTLNVAGYREKREEDLTVLAQRVANKALANRVAYALEPMNPYERRVIHTAIGEIEGVGSESKGDGDRRHLVIFCEEVGMEEILPYQTPRGDRDRRGDRGRRPGRGDRRDRGDRGDRGDKDRRPSSTVSKVADPNKEKKNDDSSTSLFSKIDI